MTIVDLEKEYIEKYQINTRVDFCCDDGWAGIIKEMIDKLEPYLKDGLKIIQVREKFGTLRFYCDGHETEEVQNIIREGELKSETTCEQCGSDNAKSRNNGWIKTLCNRCHNEREGRKKLNELADALQIPVENRRSHFLHVSSHHR